MSAALILPIRVPSFTPPHTPHFLHTCMAAVRMSPSFFTVSFPMCSSLLTWSSIEGMSTLPAVRVRRVATTKPSEIACRTLSYEGEGGEQ